MRFHVVSLPHTQTTRQFSACAFTEKVRKFCIILKRVLAQHGHEVLLYAGESNEAPCDEHVMCLSEDARQAAVGNLHYTQASFDSDLPHWREFNARVALEIGKRKRPGDFMCFMGGTSNKPIADLHPDLKAVEFGIGYPGTFAPYKVFESYAWMHTCYGAQHGGAPQHCDGHWFDGVVPGFIDMSEFPFRGEGRRENDYYLFIGRLIQRKGVVLAEQVCKAAGKRLIIAGSGSEVFPSYGQYEGQVGPVRRAELMAGARAVLVPTQYVEPFGMVAVEAMACGTPVISTDWGAMTETVVQGVTGFRCRSFREFLDALEGVKTLDPRDCRRHALKHYSLEAAAKKYQAYFERISGPWAAGMTVASGEQPAAA